MTPEEVETWLWDARTACVTNLNLRDRWWPTTGSKRMGEASAWGVAFFLRAAGARIQHAANLHAAVCNQGELGRRSTMVKSLWVGRGGKHWPHEMLVDFSVNDWDSGSPVKITGESEVGPHHGTGTSLTTDDDYSWDFFKLLVVPSPVRLFFARVGATDRGTGPRRIAELTATLTSLVGTYGGAYLRPGDELGAVIVPTAKADAALTTVLWRDGDELRHRPAAVLPPLWKGRR